MNIQWFFFANFIQLSVLNLEVFIRSIALQWFIYNLFLDRRALTTFFLWYIFSSFCIAVLFLVRILERVHEIIAAQRCYWFSHICVVFSVCTVDFIVSLITTHYYYDCICWNFECICLNLACKKSEVYRFSKHGFNSNKILFPTSSPRRFQIMLTTTYLSGN